MKHTGGLLEAEATFHTHITQHFSWADSLCPTDLGLFLKLTWGSPLGPVLISQVGRMLVELDSKPLGGWSCLSPRKYFIFAIYNFKSESCVRDS